MHIKTLLGHKKTWLWLALCWTLLVMILCLVSFNKLPTVKLSGVDKYVHVTFHFVFTVLWFGYFKDNSKNVLLKVFVASLFYGILIEIMQQLFTQTRKADIQDVAANSLGAALAITAILCYRHFTKIKD